MKAIWFHYDTRDIPSPPAYLMYTLISYVLLFL